MKIKISEIVSAVKGNAVCINKEDIITGISTDSRKVEQGNLFFALKGENFDGHNFVSDAIKKGAFAAIVADDYENQSNLPLICVKDTLKALQDLARYYRQKFDITVIGVTGSNGKTTTKDMIAAVLCSAFETLKTEGNFNNEIGLPHTLFKLDNKHQAAVLEMGMRGLGQIDQLAKIALPNMGVITNVGTTHMEVLGSRENIAIAKGELIRGLPSDGVAILNGDDPYCVKIGEDFDGKVIFYGFGDNCDVKCKRMTTKNYESQFSVEIGNDLFDYSVPLPGRHNISNALAAIAIGVEMNIKYDVIKRGLKSIKLSTMRLQIEPAMNQATVINDTYNANPDSMIASLKILHNFDLGRKIAVLGNMFELGHLSASGHQKVGETVAELGIDLLITVGDLADGIASGAIANGMSTDKVYRCDNNEKAVQFLRGQIKEQDIILVKGSRGMEMEQIVSGISSQMN